jgi:phospholipid/cholesterol/gamma-HCH transport system substrate-binding protein
MAVSVEQRVGLFFLMSMIALGVMIELVEDWRPFEKQLAYRAYFNSSIGLKVGDPVRVAGVSVGKVKQIGIEESRVRVDFYVNDTATIREDTTARIRQANMLGGIFLGLDFGTEASAILPPESVVRTEEGTNVDQLITNIDRNQERVLGPLGELIVDSRDPLKNTATRLEKIVIKIDNGEGTLGQLVNNPQLYEELVKLSSGMNDFLARMESDQGTLNKLLTDGELYDNLNQSMVNLNVLTEQMRSGKGTLGKLLNDEKLYDETTGALAQLREISEKVNNGQGSLGRLVNDGALYDNVRDSVVRINSIATKIDEGQGSLGRLVNEDTLYREAETTLHKVEKTVDGMSDTGPLSALGVVLGTLF